MTVFLNQNNTIIVINLNRKDRNIKLIHPQKITKHSSQHLQNEKRSKLFEL